MTRVALIGYGYAGRTFHAPLIRRTPGLELAVVCSSRAERVRADLPDVPIVSSPDDACAMRSIDLVVIATPHDSHVSIATMALRAGKHVVLEKPVATTLDESRQLASIARNTDRVLAVFHNRRWDGDFVAVTDLLEHGILGGVSHFESHFDRFRPAVRDRWREGAGPGAGLWYDLGPHLVDQALLLFGLPDRVTGDLAALRTGAVVDDWAHVVLEYPTRRVVLHASMLVAGRPVRFLVHGQRGTWITHGADAQEQQLQRGLDPHDPSWGSNPEPGRLIDGSTGATIDTPIARGSYDRFYSGVRDAVLGNGPNPVPVHEALAAIAVVATAIESSRQRCALA